MIKENDIDTCKGSNPAPTPFSYDSLLPDSMEDISRLNPISFSQERAEFSFQELDFLSNPVGDNDVFKVDALFTSKTSGYAFNHLEKNVNEKLAVKQFDSLKQPQTNKKRRICQIAGCKRLDRGRRFCGTHGGGRRCSVLDCFKASRKKGLSCGYYLAKMQ